MPVEHRVSFDSHLIAPWPALPNPQRDFLYLRHHLFEVKAHALGTKAQHHAPQARAIIRFPAVFHKALRITVHLIAIDLNENPQLLQSQVIAVSSKEHIVLYLKSCPPQFIGKNLFCDAVRANRASLQKLPQVPRNPPHALHVTP